MNLLYDIQGILISQHFELSIDDLITAIYIKDEKYNSKNALDLDKKTVIELISEFGNGYGLSLSKDSEKCLLNLPAEKSIKRLFQKISNELRVQGVYTPESVFILIAYHYLTTSTKSDNEVCTLLLKPIKELVLSDCPVFDFNLELKKIEIKYKQKDIFKLIFEKWLHNEQENNEQFSKIISLKKQFSAFKKASDHIFDFGELPKDIKFVRNLIDSYYEDRQTTRNLLHHGILDEDRQKTRSGNLPLPEFLRELFINIIDAPGKVFGYNCPAGEPLSILKGNIESVFSEQKSKSSLAINIIADLCQNHKNKYSINDSQDMATMQGKDTYILFPEINKKNYLIEFKSIEIPNLPDTLNSVQYCLAKVISCMKEKSFAFILVPETFLTESHAASIALREYLVKNDILNSVITLPNNSNYPSSGINMSLLILNKSKSPDMKKIFHFGMYKDVFNLIWDKAQISKLAYELGNWITIEIDTPISASKSGFANEEQIAEQEYSYNTSYYVSNYRSQKGEVTILKNLVTKIGRKDKTIDKNFPLLIIPEMTTNLLDPYLSLTPKTNKQYLRGKMNDTLIEEDALILSTIHANLRPSLFKFESTPIYIPTSAVAFRVNKEKVDPEYLRHILCEAMITSQVDIKTKGAIIQRINYFDLMSLTMRIESNPSKQIAIIEELKQKHYEDEKKRLEKLALANKITSSEVQILSAVKHSYKQLGIESLLFVLEKSIESSINKKNAIKWEAPVVNGATDSFRAHIDKLKNAVTNAASIFENLKFIIDFDKGNLNRTLEPAISTIKYLLSNIPESNNFKTRFLLISHEILHQDLEIFEIEEPKIYVDIFQFTEVIRNIFSNANKHGFNFEYSGDRYLVFAVEPNNENTLIYIYNNGNPLPINFTDDDFFSWSKTYDTNKGSGIGGYLIHKVIKNHGGEIKIIREPQFIDTEVGFGFESNFHFVITLPSLKTEL